MKFNVPRNLKGEELKSKLTLNLKQIKYVKSVIPEIDDRHEKRILEFLKMRGELSTPDDQE